MNYFLHMLSQVYLLRHFSLTAVSCGMCFISELCVTNSYYISRRTIVLVVLEIKHKQYTWILSVMHSSLPISLYSNSFARYSMSWVFGEFLTSGTETKEDTSHTHIKEMQLRS